MQDVIDPDHLTTTFDDIAGIDQVKQELQDMIILPLQQPQLFTSQSLFSLPKGVLLYGPPGTGKTMLAKALKENSMTYEVTDITKQTYKLLKTKRESAMKHQAMFEAEGHGQWFDMLIGQTEYINESFEQFKEKMARYIYVIRK